MFFSIVNCSLWSIAKMDFSFSCTRSSLILSRLLQVSNLSTTFPIMQHFLPFLCPFHPFSLMHVFLPLLTINFHTRPYDSLQNVVFPQEWQTIPVLPVPTTPQIEHGGLPLHYQTCFFTSTLSSYPYRLRRTRGWSQEPRANQVGKGGRNWVVDCDGLGSLITGIRTVTATVGIHVSSQRTASRRGRMLSQCSNFKKVGSMLGVKARRAIDSSITRPVHGLRSLVNTCPCCSSTVQRTIVGDVGSSILATFCAPGFLISTMAQRVRTAFGSGYLRVDAFLRPDTKVNNFLPISVPNAHDCTFRGSYLAKLVLSLLCSRTAAMATNFRAVTSRRLRRRDFSIVTSGVPFNGFQIFSTRV